MKTKNLIKYLSIVFVSLIIVYLLIVLTSGKRERNFKTQFFDADTSKISEILIYPKVNNHEEIKIHKEGNIWKLALQEGKSVTVPNDKINNLKKKLTELKVERLVAKSPSEWNKFQVDSSGTYVKIFAGNDLLADLVIGKFEAQGRRNFVTYLRDANEDETYSVNGFVATTFNRGKEAFRNNYILKGNSKNWQRLEFSYSDKNKAFVIEKDSTNNWYYENEKLDSAKVWRYLNSLSHLYTSNFVDDFPKDFPKTPSITLKIIGKSKTEEIKCYSKNDKYIIESTYNHDSYFDGNKSKLKEKIFKSINEFSRDRSPSVKKKIK